DEAPALDARIGRGARELGERLREVDVERDPAVLARAWDEWRIAHDQRIPHALLVLALLGLPAMRAPRVAVVGGVHDDRAGEHAAGLECLHDGIHRLVDRLQALELALAKGVGAGLVLLGPG